MYLMPKNVKCSQKCYYKGREHNSDSAPSSIYVLYEPKLYQIQEAVNCIWTDSKIDLPASGRLWEVSVMCGCLAAFSLDVTYSKIRHWQQK